MIWCAWGGLQSLKDEVLRRRLRDTSKYDQDFINNIAVKYKAAWRQTGRDEANLYGVSSYYVSKFLLNGHTRLLAQRLTNGSKGSKIYVNCVHPGVVDTDMLQYLRDSMTPIAFTEFLASGIHGIDVLSTEEAADTPV